MHLNVEKALKLNSVDTFLKSGEQKIIRRKKLCRKNTSLLRICLIYLI